MAESSASLASRVASELIRRDQAAAMLGITLISVDQGAACLEMAMRPDLLNGYQTCHGGILFALADTAFGMASNSRNLRAVAASGQMDFLRPGLPGDVLRATAVERSSGRRLSLYDVTITNQKGQVLALFRGTACRIDGTIVPEANSIEEPVS